MGRMARGALTFIDRGVLRLGPLLTLNRIGMALATDLHEPALEKRLLGGRVGAVAVQAARFVQQRPVHPVLAEHVVQLGAVASAAQLEPRPFRREGRGRRCIFMALIAHLIGNRLVNVRVEHPCPIRTMRIMTARAARFRDGIVHVLFLERRRCRLVALQAESRHLIL